MPLPGQTRLREHLDRAFASQDLEARRKARVYATFLSWSVAIMALASLVFFPLRPRPVLVGMGPVLVLALLSLAVLLRGHLNAAVGTFALVLTGVIFFRTVFWEHTPPVFLARSTGEFLFRLMFPLLAAMLFGSRRSLMLLVAGAGFTSLVIFFGLHAERFHMSPYSLAWALGMYAILVALGLGVSGLNRNVIHALEKRSADLQESHDVLSERNQELRRTQAELEEYRHHLEEIVQRRTRALHEAQDELVRKDRLATVGQLAAAINHELRNPLSALSNAVVALRQQGVGERSPRRARALDIAERNIARCTTIVGEFLDFSRRPQPQPVPTDLDTWLRDLLEEMERPPGVELRHDLRAGVTLDVDRELLRRAVTNLVQNGIQATVEAGAEGETPWVRVATEADDARALIHVSDSGDGVPQELRARIFEPLFSTRTFGVGLGLPIVRHAVEELGGEVTLERGSEAGASFRLTLPRSRT